MSNFSNLFPNYPEADYINARDNLIKKDENSALADGDDGAGAYGFGTAYTIGYGYDVSQQSNGNQIISDFTTAGIFNSSNTTGTGPYANLYTLLQNYKNGTGHHSTSLSALNTEFLAAFGGDNGL